MPSQMFVNNGAGAIAANATAGAVTLTLDADALASFPTSIPAGDYYYATLIGYDNEGRENAWEIVQVTARSGSQITVVRAQEGTTALAWDSGTRIEIRLTAATLAKYETSYNYGDHNTQGYLTNVTEAAVTTHQAALSIDFSQIQNFPSYAASGHSHAIADVTGLQAALDSKVGNNTNADFGQITLGASDWTIRVESGDLVFDNGVDVVRFTGSDASIQAAGDVGGGYA